MKEMEELKAFRAELDVPPPGALTRARARALRGAPAAQPSWIWLRRLAIPAAALVVIAIVVSLSLVANRGMSPTAPPPSLPPTTQAAIDWLAGRAESGAPPPRVRENHLVQVTNRFFRQGRWSEDSFRLDPYGLIDVSEEEKGDKARFRELLAERRASRGTEGDAGHPTPEWLGGLSGDPQKLRPIFESDCAAGCPAGEEDWRVWQMVVWLVRSGDVLISPQGRAGLIRLLGGFPGVTVHEATIEDRVYWAIRYPTPRGPVAEVYVDPSSGRMHGESSAPGVEYAFWRVELVTF